MKGNKETGSVNTNAGTHALGRSAGRRINGERRKLRTLNRQEHMNAKYGLSTLLTLLAALSAGSAQPFITTQPQNQTNVVGTTATFTVGTTNPPPIFYQWRFNAGLLDEADVTGQTNTTLVLTNVQVGNAGPYAVVVSNVDGAITSAVATLTVLVPPSVFPLRLSGQSQTVDDAFDPYVSPSVSFGANILLATTAQGTPPLYSEWRFNQLGLPGKTNVSLNRFVSAGLVLTNLQLTNAGDYTLVVTNVAGSATSQVMTLTVDAVFTKINAGPIVTDNVGAFSSIGGTWGEYNNDGFLDLFVYNGDGGATHPCLYRNNGDGTFTKITNGSPVSAVVESYSASWGDYDNDGNLDLFVGGHSSTLLYRNDGNGTFTPITNSGFALDAGAYAGAAWGDYDNDGLLDLILDEGHAGQLGHEYLYHNNGDGTFAKIATGSIANDLVDACGCAWGDYDNDGYLDLFVCNGGYLASETNFLYHNNGDGTFTRMTSNTVGSIASDAGRSIGCAWGDYDNDGFLDLYVGNEGGTDQVPTVVNFLYHNNGDGTFTRITTGSPVNEYSDSWGVCWADYDNDGFLDLFASRGDGRGNSLYRNNGNSNSWLTVKLLGTASNRSAIGAKVRVKATIGGVSRWQLRQITGGTGFPSHNELRANFGLGDARNIDTVRIEWPSGIVQTLTNVTPKQILTVVERQQPGSTNAPSFTSVFRASNGVVNLSVAGDTNLIYVFEASTNLMNWSWLGVRSNATGTIQFTDPKATNYASRFYRVSVP